jgi:large subunit ribosomal protein L17e
VDDLRAHFKNTFETARAIRGLKLKKAIKYMENVLEHKQVIPYFRYTGKIGRTAQAKAFSNT